MLGKISGQLDIISQMMYDKLMPKKHLLIDIDKYVDFSFIYDEVKEYYSDTTGRNSKDPVVVFKMLLLEYLYVLSDRKVEERCKTDIIFRWFLRLNIDDEVPDSTTLVNFRSIRLGDKPFEEFFNEIVQQCIDNDLVKINRMIIDSTDVAANVNYPREKKLVCNAYRKLIKELAVIDGAYSEIKLQEFEKEIDDEKKISEKTDIKKYCKVAKRHAEEIYIKTYDELKESPKYYDAFVTLWRIIEHYGENKTKTDRIISCVDPDARVGNKTKGNLKRGYKDHIIIDEDSEIILASEQTPFNEGDELHLIDLIEKAEETFGLKPNEVSADIVYGTIGNRAYLKDNDIISTIAFRDYSNKENQVFGIRDFDVAENLTSITCPNGCTTTNKELKNYKSGKRLEFAFSKEQCTECPLRSQCAKSKFAPRKVDLSPRYDAVVRDLHRNESEEFKKAYGNRYKVERRFATMVRNNGLRRCKYLRLKGAKIHITLANTACNIVRMVNLLNQRASLILPCAN